MTTTVDPNILRIDGKVAIVTGAGQGVGRGIAHFLATYGAKVSVFDYFLERAETVAQEIRDAGGEAIAVQGDVTDQDSVQALVDATVEAFGGLNILVNNAGNSGPGASLDIVPPLFWETEREDWEKFIGVNFDGVYNTSRAAIPEIIKSGEGGRIITIISDAGRVGEPFLVAYSGAKAGAAGLTRGLAKALGRHNITVNNISLGGIRTPASEAASTPENLARVLKLYTIRRQGEVEDVASAALFLSSGAASWITGQTLPVNGGYSFAL